MKAETSYQPNGTFLVQFQNVSIKIEGKEYNNFGKHGSQLGPQAIQMKPQEKSRINLLSLEQLEDLHIKNSKWVKTLQGDTNKALIVSSVAMVITF